MNKLEVGMYVRIKDSGIDKITSIFDDEIRFREKPIFSDGECIGYKWCYQKDIVKSSHNIIDLIEVGDYVNGEIVKSVPLTKCVDCAYKGRWRIANCSNEDIKSIVTKEQYESMEYKLGDSNE